MSTSQRRSQVTQIIADLVPSNKSSQYEQALYQMNKELEGVSGFVGLDIIRPAEHNSSEYLTILRFDTEQSLRKWKASSVHIEWEKRLHALGVSEKKELEKHGLEVWFTLPDNATEIAAKPAYYKLVIVGILAVYPLVIGIDTLIGPYTDKFPFALSLLISTVLVSALLTWPVMPGLTRMLRPWLYPTSSKQA